MTDQNTVTEFKTIEQRGRGDIFEPGGYGELIKPGELIDIVELSPLTRSDRVIYNLLLANAWDRIGDPVVHRIEKAKLKGTHESNDRLEDSINRLMGTIAVAYVEKNGKKAKQKVQLLGPNLEETEQKGFIYYRFPEELIELISNSNIYARLKAQVMHCFSCKYALCLWEMVEKRKGLQFKQKDRFTIDEIRALLNVDKGDYKRFADLNRRVLKKAMKEVNAYGDCYVYFKPIKDGRKVVAIEMSWYNKTPEAKRKTIAEVDRCSIGRRARLKGTVEEVSIQ